MWYRWSILLILVLTALIGSVAVVQAEEGPATCTPVLFPSPNERFGFGVTDKGNGISSYNVLPLNAGWYLNWGLNPNAPHPGGIIGVHEIHLDRDGLHVNPTDIARITEDDPGALWIIGNEPDVVVMDNVTPSQYATQYRQAYYLIKGYDPTAQVAAGGVAQPTRLRLGWLSAVWDAYQQQFGNSLPADLWNIHNFILREKLYDWGCGIPRGYFGPGAEKYRDPSQHDDVAIFQSQILAMRQWMKDHGQQDKPLINSEYGILFPADIGFDLARVRAFFINTANWMLTATDPLLGYPADEQHLVQRWLWYSLDDTNFNYQGETIGALMEPITHSMREMGQVFAGQTTPLRRPYANLVVARVRMTAVDGSAISLDVAQPVTVSVTIQNRGNTAISTPFRVLIQDGQGLTTTATINGLPARYGGDAQLQVPWLKPAGTNWRLTVSVDPDNAIPESNECDNQRTTVPAADLYLISLTALNARGEIIGASTASGPITLTAEIQNLSNLDLSGATLRFQDGAQLPPLASLPLSRLAPQARIIVTFPWVPGIGLHELQAAVILPSGVSDPVESNNAITHTFLVFAHRAAFPFPVLPQPSPCRNVVVNSGFEDGTLRGWQASRWVQLWRSTQADRCADDTQWCVRIERSYNMDYYLQQTITLTSLTSGAPLEGIYLTYQWGVNTATPGVEPRDTFTVTLRSTIGDLLRTVEVVDNRNPPAAWSIFGTDLNLNDFANQTIQLRFDAHHYMANTSFWLDEINVEVCEQRP